MQEEKTKIAILGGGISALWTAFELTHTPELRALHEVTLYQRGWRLGGKLASGANAKIAHRNEEHGLHVWFGCYENAFRNLKAVYAELREIHPDFRYRDYLDAFEPLGYTPVGFQTERHQGWWNLNWPDRPGRPGEARDEDDTTVPETADALLNVLAALRANLGGFVRGARRGKLARLLERVSTRLLDTLIAQVTRRKDAGKPVRGLGLFPVGLRMFRVGVLPSLRRIARRDPDRYPLISMLDLGSACLAGILNPRYGILEDFNLNRINHLDLREWLRENGADPRIVARSSFLRSWYNIPFQYEDGDLERPRFAAGSALIFAGWLMMRYRGSFAYLPRAGFGEVVIAPLYAVLKARGVRFRFFHRLTNLELDATGQSIQRIHLDREVRVKDDGEYRPVVWRAERRLLSWPTEPFWDQIAGGAELAAAGVDPESHWNNLPPHDRVVLEAGQDFDQVVLGIALGAFKPLNDGDPSPCRELIAKNERFRAMTAELPLVATQAAQIWFKRSRTELGWERRLSSGGGPAPFDVFADMGQTTATEDWPGARPGTVAYLCGPLHTTLFQQPASDATVPDRALRLVRANARDWLGRHGRVVWPAANADDFAFAGRMDDDADLDAEREIFLKANVEPTDCIIASAPGTIRYRLRADESGFRNLFLTGAWTYTGINVTCVEGATIAARLCARAISGQPVHIHGEHFLNRHGSDGRQA